MSAFKNVLGENDLLHRKQQGENVRGEYVRN